MNAPFRSRSEGQLSRRQDVSAARVRVRSQAAVMRVSKVVVLPLSPHASPDDRTDTAPDESDEQTRPCEPRRRRTRLAMCLAKPTIEAALARALDAAVAAGRLDDVTAFADEL